MTKMHNRILASNVLASTRALALAICLGAALAASPLLAQEYGASYPGGAAAFELSGGTLTYQILASGNANGVTVGGTDIGVSFNENSYAAGSVSFAGDLDGASLQILGGPSATIVQTAEGDGGGGDPPDTSPCAENAGCVLDDRFEVMVSATLPSGGTVAGIPNTLTTDTDWFYFEGFDPGNVEVFVKVPTGTCFINNRLWVFAGGATDLAVDIRVRDTTTGDIKNYVGSAGPFVAINDTGAFANCPQ